MAEVTLGVLTAVGGVIDIGNLVANPQAGARFGMSLAWVIVLGVVGIVVYAEMAGRVAAVSHRPVFGLIRERLGPRAALGGLVASFLITFLTLAAEIAGVALAIELATSVNYLAWIPLVALLVFVILWKVQFQTMERVFGVAGLAMVVAAVAVWRLHPDWTHLVSLSLHPTVPSGEGHATYWYFAIAQLGSVMTPYQVFFFSSGGVEERWTSADLVVEKGNVFLGFPLGGGIALALMTLGALVLEPHAIRVDALGQALLPVPLALGKIGLAVVIIGVVAATMGAALETSLSCGYTIAQYFGWQWGKSAGPREAARFYLVLVISLVLAAALGLTTLDPFRLTELAIVFGAAALPLTYFPILVVANDRAYMGDKRNKAFANALGTGFLVLLLVVSAATIPLMIVTKLGT